MLAAAAATGGDIRLTNVPCRDLYAVFTKVREMGCEIDEEESTVRLRAPQRLTAFQQLQTQPHPGFPTDMQAQMLALAAMAKGTSVVVENVFENRFAHAGDLNRMGANVLVNGRTAVVQGVDMLYGTHVTARDLRGGAALVIAGLAARGRNAGGARRTDRPRIRTPGRDAGRAGGGDPPRQRISQGRNIHEQARREKAHT